MAANLPEAPRVLASLSASGDVHELDAHLSVEAPYNTRLSANLMPSQRNTPNQRDLIEIDLANLEISGSLKVEEFQSTDFNPTAHPFNGSMSTEFYGELNKLKAKTLATLVLEKDA